MRVENIHSRESRDGMQGQHSGRRVTLWKKSDSGALEEEHIGCALEEEHMGMSLEEGNLPNASHAYAITT